MKKFMTEIEDESYELAFELDNTSLRRATLEGFAKGAGLALAAGLAIAAIASVGVWGALGYCAIAAIVGGAAGASAHYIYTRGQMDGAEEAIDLANSVLDGQLQAPSLQEAPQQEQQTPQLHKSDHAAKLLEARAAKTAAEMSR